MESNIKTSTDLRKKRQRKQPGYVHLATYVPKEVYDLIKADADSVGCSMSLISSEIIQDHYEL